MSRLLLTLSPMLRFMRREWLLVVAVCFALLYSLYQFTEVPPTWYDEGMIIQLAMNLERYGSMATQTAPGIFVSGAYTSTGFPVVVPVATSFALFGTSLASARAVMVIFVALLILASYFFVKRFANRKAALWSTILLVSFSSLYGNGKNVLGEVPGLFFLCLFLIFVHALFEAGKASRKNAILAGLFFGLCIATKPTFLVLGVSVLVALIYRYFSRGHSAFPFRLVPWGVGAALIPILIWLLTQFSSGDDFPRVFAFYANPYQIADVGSVMSNNFLRFFTETTPFYLLGMLTVWGGALAIKIAKKEQLSFVEVTSASFVLFIILAYLRTPGWYRYLFPAQIVSTFFFPNALMYIGANFPIHRLQKFFVRIVPYMLVLLLVVQLYVLFFTSWLSGYSNSSRNRVLAEYFGAWNPTVSILIYDNPQIPLFLPKGASYYQYIEVNADGYWGIGDEVLESIQHKIPDAVAVSSEDLEKNLFAGYSENETVAGIHILRRD